MTGRELDIALVDAFGVPGKLTVYAWEDRGKRTKPFTGYTVNTIYEGGPGQQWAPLLKWAHGTVVDETGKKYSSLNYPRRFHRDIEPMTDAEALLGDRGLGEAYVQALWKLVHGDNPDASKSDTSQIYALLIASPETRCRAAITVLTENKDL